MSRSAFTLVELLICVGILVILMSLLMPTLGEAAEGARRISCLNNLRQLGVQMHGYWNVSRGRSPRPAQTGVPLAEDWIHWQPGRDMDTSGLRLVNRRALVCRSDDIGGHPLSVSGSYPYSYSVNANICRIGMDTVGLSRIRSPSRVILFVDESQETLDDGAWAWQPQMGGSRNRLATRHDRRGDREEGRGNVCFVDGHADYIFRKDSFDPRYYMP